MVLDDEDNNCVLMMELSPISRPLLYKIGISHPQFSRSNYSLSPHEISHKNHNHDGDRPDLYRYDSIREQVAKLDKLGLSQMSHYEYRGDALVQLQRK